MQIDGIDPIVTCRCSANLEENVGFPQQTVDTLVGEVLDLWPMMQKLQWLGGPRKPSLEAVELSKSGTAVDGMVHSPRPCSYHVLNMVPKQTGQLLPCSYPPETL